MLGFEEGRSQLQCCRGGRASAEAAVVGTERRSTFASAAIFARRSTGHSQRFCGGTRPKCSSEARGRATSTRRAARQSRRKQRGNTGAAARGSRRSSGGHRLRARLRTVRGRGGVRMNGASVEIADGSRRARSGPVPCARWVIGRCVGASPQERGLRSACAGAPGGIRTPGLLVRSQLLYPAELRARLRTL